jgi:UPF0755 protein
MVMIPVFAGIVTYGVLKNYFLLPAQPTMTSNIIFEISQGKGLSHIAIELKEKGVIKSILALKILARITSENLTIQAGEYELSGSMTPNQILRKLLTGDTKKRHVVFKEGATLWDMATALEEAGVAKKEDFITAATDPLELKRLGVNAPSFEGYLFPNTYELSRPVNIPKLIVAMLQDAETKWPEAYTQQVEILGMDRHQVLTLASMIQKEAGDVSEMPKISSVFHNRLKQGMKLQCDSTVIYGIKDFNGNLTKVDLETDTPYNTYTRYDLPVGPIGNPGEEAIRAALFPEATNHLYFVANGKGKHIFSDNLKDHNAAVQEYQVKPAQNGANDKS